MNLIKVSIPNWAKYNPRTDRTITVWLRFQNDFFGDQKLWGLTDSQRLTFIFILCEASKVQKDTVDLNVDYVADQRKKSRRQIVEDIKALEDIGVLHPPNGGRAPDEIPATLQTNTTNKQKNIAHPDGFADFWSGYPRKVGKGKAEKAYLAAIKAGASPEDLLAARDKYRKHCESTHTESQYIKHGSTFMGEWRDWLDPETGQAEDFSEKNKSYDWAEITGTKVAT